MHTTYTSLWLALLLCSYLTANGDLSLRATVVNPISARVDVTVTDSNPVLECNFQCRDDSGAFVECQCDSRKCNTNCQSDTVVGLFPGTLNTIVVNQRVGTNQWASYSVSIELPFVDYNLNLIQVTKTTVSAEVVPITTGSYVSDSCSIKIANTNDQIFNPATCEGGCNPCTRFTITGLESANGYQLRVLPNFARNPLFVDFRTFAYTYLLEPVEINENNATIRIIRGDAPTTDTCNFLIIGQSQNINTWVPAKCDHTDRCPDDCSSLLHITELKARENYTLAMNSTGTSEEVRLEFLTGNVEYRGRLTGIGFTWASVEFERADGSDFDDDACHYFVTSVQFGTTLATCDTGVCPDNCVRANITNLQPGTQYRLNVVPWKHGSRFFVDFYTKDVILTLISSNIFPTKLNMNFGSNYEPRGNCSYRLRDRSNKYIPLVCQPRTCPTDCMSANFTGMKANTFYTLEIHNTYASVVLVYSFTTKNVNYNITQLSSRVRSLTFTITPDVDYSRNDLEDCTFTLQRSSGERVPLVECNNPPCGYDCSYYTFQLNLDFSGERYLLYMNSSFSDKEHYTSMYTVQSDITLEQKETTTNSVEVKVAINETVSSIECSVYLYDNTNNPLTPVCTGNCPSKCESFTLQNLAQSQTYKVVLKSNLKLTDTELTAYTLFVAPNIVSHEITSISSIRVKWNYDFLANKDFVFTVFALDKNGILLFGNAYYPPTVSANLILLPPETDMDVHVCASPIRAETLTNCNHITTRIPVTVPDPLGGVSILSVSGKKVDIALPPITPYQGNISECFVYSIYLLKDSYLSNLKVPPQNKILFGGIYFGYRGVSGILQAKLTAEECRRTQSFQIGDGRAYNGVKNRPIRGDNLVTVFVRSCIDSTACSDSSIPLPVYIGGSNISVIIITVLSILIILAFVSYSVYTNISNKSIFKINLNSDLFENTAQVPDDPDATIEKKSSSFSEL